MQKECYIISIGIASEGDSSFTWERNVFVDQDDAYECFNEFLKNVILNGDYTDEQINEMLDDTAGDTVVDVNNNWIISMKEGILYA